MKSFQGHTQISGQEIFHFISEPGDCTHYEYLAIKDYDDYKFISMNSSGMIYPQKISKWDVPEVMPNYKDHNLKGEIIDEIASKYKCNVWTVVECMRTILEIEKGELNEKD